ncbi:MAG: PDGLE domain-containing protein [Ilumatobacteraceae bacterium]
MIPVVVTGLVVALALAVFVSPFASSSPDGLEKVAAEKSLDTEADDHALAGSPLGDYGVEGVDDERVATGLAGLIGVGVTFGVGLGVFALVKATRRRPGSDASPDADGRRAAALGSET